MKSASTKYIGICLSGSKNDKTFLARFDEYKKENKLVLSSLKSAPSASVKISGDKLLIDEISKIQRVAGVGVDAPLQLPKCMRCKLKCPGYEKCKLPVIKAMWKIHSQERKKRKYPFSPYTERLAEMYINSIEKDVFLTGALGANLAPLTARAIFLEKHFKSKLKEVYPRLVYLRLAKMFHMTKKQINTNRLSEEGVEARWEFLKRFTESMDIFMYYQDVQAMVDNPFAFDAFLVALGIYMDKKSLAEPRPKILPKGESWPIFPKSDIEFSF